MAKLIQELRAAGRVWRPILAAVVLGAAAAVIACHGTGTEGQEPGSQTRAPAVVSAATIPGAPPPGEWPLPGRDVQNTRFSPLALITPQNVGRLKLAWTFSTGTTRGFEGQPLVVNNTMYIVTPWPNHVFALDLTSAKLPVKWHYRPRTARASQGEACCDVVNRGASYADGKIVFNRLDDHTVALDANTGALLWDTQLDSIVVGATYTMAPLVVNGRVYVGNSGAELGVRGFLAALDLNTGKLLWQAYSTGPDRDVLIGPQFKPYYPQFKGKDLGVTTWPPNQWKLGGGTAWGWISYDPDLNQIYYGTGNPGVWNPDMRPGDNLWSTTIFARDPATGQAMWAYQFTPHDAWDYDGVNENIPFDLTIDGRRRRLLAHFDRNGFAYTIDRTNGQVLVAQPFEFLNWSTGVDLRTGRPARIPGRETHQGVNTRGICPSSSGARDQQPAAYSPRLRLFFSPGTDLCMNFAGYQASYIAGTPYLGATVDMYAGSRGWGARGNFFAWDPVTGKRVWFVTERFPPWSGALVTGSDLVFYGTLDGWFKARDARTGQLLWQFKTGSGIVGNAITYLGPDGKQYVAIYSGVGGWLGAVALGLSPGDPTAALGAVGAVPDLPRYTAPGGMVYVFTLP